MHELPATKKAVPIGTASQPRSALFHRQLPTITPAQRVSKPAGGKVFLRLPDLGLGIHDERTTPRNRFIEWPAGNEQKTRTGITRARGDVPAV